MFIADASCGEFNCDPNADCMFDSQQGSYCHCRDGYFGTGVQCRAEVEGMCGRFWCDVNAECDRSGLGQEPNADVIKEYTVKAA